MLVLVLGLGLVVSCTGADKCVDGRGDVSTAVVVKGIGVGVTGVVVTAGGGGGVPGDAGGVEVAAVGDIGVEKAGGGDEAGGVNVALAVVVGVVVVEDVGGVAGAAAAPVIVVVVVEMQGQRGVSETRGAGLSMVDVEGHVPHRAGGGS